MHLPSNKCHGVTHPEDRMFIVIAAYNSNLIHLTVPHCIQLAKECCRDVSALRTQNVLDLHTMNEKSTAKRQKANLHNKNKKFHEHRLSEAWFPSYGLLKIK